MKKGYLSILILSFLLVTVRTKAETNVSGQISANTTWTLSGSPYNIIGSILVNEGITLIIEAGVTIKINTGLAIQVSGTLIARGTSSSLITLTKSGTSNWGYLLFSDKSSDATYDAGGNYKGGSVLEYCVIEYSGGLSVSENGAIRLDAAHPFINYCTIKNNSSTGIRGYNLTGTLKISNNSIAVNASTDYGGGIYVSGTTAILSIINNTISNNSTTRDGGGIFCNSGTTTINVSGNRIDSNKANHGAGVVIVGNGIIYLNNNDIMNNIAAGEGAIHCGCCSHTTTITGNKISNNSSTGSGGAIFQSGGTVSIFNNLISGNSTNGHGGGIYGGTNITGNLIIENSSKGAGGGLFASGKVLNNIIIGNSATLDGGGIATQYGLLFKEVSRNIIANNISLDIGGGTSGEWEKLTNNLLYKNLAKDGSAVYQTGSFGSLIQYNCVIQNKNTAESLTNCTFFRGPISLNYNNFINNICLQELYNNNAQNTGNLNALNNWWGTTLDQTIQSKIYDWFDDASKGIVDYQPFETAPRTDAPISPPSNVFLSGNILTWSANPEGDVAGYRIYWDTDAGFPYANSSDAGKVTSFNIQNLPAGSYIAVTAYDNNYSAANEDLNTITNENQTNGNESWYAEAAQAPPSVPVLSSPANGANDMSTQPTFKWRKSTGAISYHLTVSSDTNFASGIIYDQSVTDTLQKVTSLANNTKYFWKVNASNESSTSQYSATWSFKTALISASIGSVSGTSPLCAGATASFTANNVVLAGGTGSWSSSNVTVASVNSSGLVTAVSAGTCNIIYTITGGTGGTVTAQQSLTVNPASSILSVTGADTGCRWETTTFTANSVILGEGTGSWSSSDSQVATVNSQGEVYGYYYGTCDIIYTITGGCNGTVSAKKSITINPYASVSSVSGQSSICIGSTATFTANNVTLSGGTGAWSSSNTSIATVNSSGLVTGISAGSCTITYTITGGCGGTDYASATVTIGNASIASVTGTSPVCVGSVAYYSANSVLLGGGTGSWSSSNANVATVSSSGEVYGVAEGTCNIIYTITGGCGGTVSSQKSVTLSPVSSITSVTGTSPLCVGQTIIFTANGIVLGSGTGAWSSSNPAVATVNSSGWVTGISSGSCNIIYTITGGCGGTKSRQQAVSINPSASIASVSGASSLCAGATATYTANSVVLGGGTGAWSSNNETVAVVNSSGVVTSKTGGTCDIIYTITGNSCSGTISARTPLIVSSLPTFSSVSNGSSCGPGAVTLYASPTAGTVSWYQAQAGGTELGTGTLFTTPNLSLTTTYFVEAKSGNCISSSRAPVTANVYEIPAPDISVKWGDVLVCSNTANTFESYQWINGQIQIPGATKQYYVTGKQPGTYKVEITDKNGCKGTSAEITLKSGTGNISLFPNPVKSEIQINFSNDMRGRVLIRFLNESGNLFKEATFEKTEQNFHNIIDVNNLLSGIYFIKISINGIPVADSKIVVVK